MSRLVCFYKQRDTILFFDCQDFHNKLIHHNFSSASVLFLFNLNLSRFHLSSAPVPPFAACIRPAVTKPTLIPTKKSTSPTTSFMVSFSFFVFHSLPCSLCQMGAKPVVRRKFSCPGARFFCCSVAQPRRICYTAVSIPRFYEILNETR